MNIILITGILLFSYGIYNTFCYIFLLPTANTSRKQTGIGTEEKISFASIASILISEVIVRKWNLKWNRADTFEEVLKERGIYTEGTVYLISRGILYLLAVLLAIPLLFINRNLFCSVILISVLGIVRDIYNLTRRKRTALNKRIITNYTCKLLPGAFLIGQIILFASLLT